MKGGDDMNVSDNFNTNTQATLLTLKYFNQPHIVDGVEVCLSSNATKVPSSYVNAMYTLAVEATTEGKDTKIYYIVIDSRYSKSNNRFVPTRVVLLDFSQAKEPELYVGDELINEFHEADFLDLFFKQVVAAREAVGLSYLDRSDKK